MSCELGGRVGEGADAASRPQLKCTVRSSTGPDRSVVLVPCFYFSGQVLKISGIFCHPTHLQPAPRADDRRHTCRRAGKPGTATAIIAVVKVGKATHATATVTKGTATATVATATATATGVDHGPALQRALTSRRASGDAMTTRAQRRAASTGGRAATSRAHAARAARRDGASDRGVSRAGLQAGRPRHCPRIATRTSRRSL